MKYLLTPNLCVPCSGKNCCTADDPFHCAVSVSTEYTGQEIVEGSVVVDAKDILVRTDGQALIRTKSK